MRRPKVAAVCRSISMGLVLVCTILGLGTVSGDAAPPQLSTVRVAGAASLSAAPHFIADKEGFFARQGIRFEFIVIPTFGEASGPLLQGQIDVFSGPVSAGFFNAVAAGQRARIVAGAGYYAPGDKTAALVVRKDLMGAAVKRLADLRGHTIAVNSIRGTSQYLIEKILARDNLKVSEVRFVRMPFSAMVAALLNRAVDAAFFGEPWITLAERQGSAVPIIYVGEATPGEDTGSVLTYGPRLLDRDRALGQRFMVAFLQGLRQYMRGQTDRNVNIIAEFLKIDPVAVREATWFSMYLDGRLDASGVRRFQDWLYDIGEVQLRSPLDQLLDMSFAQQAARALERP